jgi:transposase InsO family protein
MKRRNRNWGCPRIAQQIALAFGIGINKDVVRRILSVHYRPGSDSGGPSWLTFIGHMKDSLWSCDLFRCESATLRTHWVLVVMDQFTRRVIGFGVHSGIVDGVALCRMFQRAIGAQSLPKYLSSDHDPLYRFHQWQANLRVLEVTEIKTVPYVPLSHPFVERLIGTIRRECLDRTLFWTTVGLEMKLFDFQHYYNGHRRHAGIEGRLPATAEAYSLNMTVVPQGPLGYLTAWPAGQAQPEVSTLNVPKGFALANAAIVRAGTSGSINTFVTDLTDVIIDTNGYFAP